MNNQQKNIFMVLLALSQAFAIAMVILTVVWTKDVLDGYAWDGSKQEFNLHPLCMICGFILLYGEAIIVFRVFRNHEKQTVKLFHGGLHLLGFVAVVVGLVAVFEFHDMNKIANMYSLHSWCGLTTVLLFCIQYAFGLVTFLFPGTRESLKILYLPVHKYFGVAILFLSAAAAVSGINEKMFFEFKTDPAYSALPYGAVIGNCLGLITVGYVVTVAFITSNPDWKRERDSSEEPLSVHFQQIRTRPDSDEE